ncbi:MAG: hypothetical protein CL943_02150 [Candidatus Diapherotrites archaeon]|uniref:Uncharacterized protein n=1 Tax=Candidatus Iainarchaeum sp. TaxID=3101447 RepID=A0A2D6M0Z0_9ARCH|nr:hypothetical protein [Candidatus Diapherotrites archaeon]|tara:strand:- start:1777 stop:2217 length:441 start_codon:yes stop_codon:yes gene_type:complete
MRAIILIVLFLLLLYSPQFFAACGAITTTPGCQTAGLVAGSCRAIKVSNCSLLTGAGTCDAGFITPDPLYTGTSSKGRACSWLGASCTTGAIGYLCTCYDTGSTKINCTAVPEFFGIEFNEMEFSTGIIALIVAIVLPMFLFRKKR